jgi:hypothetical protein
LCISSSNSYCIHIWQSLNPHFVPFFHLLQKADDSPEVVISGTSTFKDRQKQLADEADAVYNKKVHAKSNHVNNTLKTGGANLQVQAEVVEVVDVDKLIPKRTPKVNGFVTLQPKNSLVFPLPENSRFPVSDDDIMHFCAIVELAYTDRVQKYVSSFCTSH